MSHTIWSALDWSKECAFIAAVADKQGKIQEFSYDTECFKRYCEMQANAAAKQGFLDSEEYIRQCIDDLI
jgi:hypothetical protein